MNTAVIRRFLRDRRVALAVYTVGALLFALMYTSLYPSLKSQMQNYDDILKSFPKGFTDALGVEDISFSSPPNGGTQSHNDLHLHHRKSTCSHAPQAQFFSKEHSDCCRLFLASVYYCLPQTACLTRPSPENAPFFKVLDCPFGATACDLMVDHI